MKIPHDVAVAAIIQGGFLLLLIASLALFVATVIIPIVRGF